MHITTSPARRTAKSALAFGMMLACLAVVFFQIAHVPLRDIREALGAITVRQWLIATLATAVSFWAIGQYDMLWHTHLKTGVSPKTSRRSGMAAVAIGQTVGLGVVTGTVVRWHMTQLQTVQTATKITLGVAASFFACWLGLALLAGMVLRSIGVETVVLALVASGFLLPIVLRRMGQAALRSKLPRLMYLTTIDVVFAGLALWAMIPEAGADMVHLVVAAYVLALGAGLASNAPGGLGAFEMSLILMLPQVPEPALIAGILGFRLIYYVIPTILAATAFIQAHRRSNPPVVRITSDPISDLCHQGARITHAANVTRAHLFGTIVLEPQRKLPRTPMTGRGFLAYYKADPRVAAQARARGWAVRHIADDAMIDLQTWSDTGPNRRQLRRKLKQAQTAGVGIKAPVTSLPLDDMTDVARQWRAAHGGELGYAMGRYTPAYVAHQRVFLIYHAERLCGFVTVQTRQRVWAIDLMRHLPQIPAGAVHLAITTIIAAAQSEGVKHLSLGAVPNGPRDSRWQNRVTAQKAGLRQFKDSFGPRWSPRYHVAPSPRHWAVSIALAVVHIQRPIPRLPDILRRKRNEFINFTRIIHLNQRRTRVTDKTNTVRTKAQLHDEPLFQTVG